MRMDSLHNLIAIAAILDLEMGQMDIRGTYLNGDLHESIYMQQPEGYEDGMNRVTNWSIHSTDLNNQAENGTQNSMLT
jgi:Reverse transcriptase (RNA-dependent DNA polymerase)